MNDVSDAPSINKLEWEHTPFYRGEEWIAVPIPGYLKYSIMKHNKTIDEEYLIYINYDLKKKTNDLNEAKHIAQADFENKIGGCLS